MAYQIRSEPKKQDSPVHLHREKQYQVGIDSNGEIEYEFNDSVYLNGHRRNSDLRVGHSSNESRIRDSSNVYHLQSTQHHQSSPKPGRISPVREVSAAARQSSGNNHKHGQSKAVASNYSIQEPITLQFECFQVPNNRGSAPPPPPPRQYAPPPPPPPTYNQQWNFSSYGQPAPQAPVNHQQPLPWCSSIAPTAPAPVSLPPPLPQAPQNLPWCSSLPGFSSQPAPFYPPAPAPFPSFQPPIQYPTVAPQFNQMPSFPAPVPAPSFPAPSFPAPSFPAPVPAPSFYSGAPQPSFGSFAGFPQAQSVAAPSYFPQQQYASIAAPQSFYNQGYGHSGFGHQGFGTTIGGGNPCLPQQPQQCATPLGYFRQKRRCCCSCRGSGCCLSRCFRNCCRSDCCKSDRCVPIAPPMPCPPQRMC